MLNLKKSVIDGAFDKKDGKLFDMIRSGSQSVLYGETQGGAKRDHSPPSATSTGGAAPLKRTKSVVQVNPTSATGPSGSTAVSAPNVSALKVNPLKKLKYTKE